jgi:hypothetical protein
MSVTFSPSFECSLDGLRSAVRLRYVLWGVKDPDAKTQTYMDGYAISEENGTDPEVLRKRIELIIGDIEREAVRQASGLPE